MPAKAAKTKTIGDENTKAVDPRKQYVTGGVLPTYNGSGTRILSGLGEDGIKVHSPRTYEQMAVDPKISKTLNVLKVGVLGDGIQFLPSVAESDENFETAALIAEFCTKAMVELDMPLRYVLEQMMDALIYGYKVAEITYKNTPLRGFDGTYLIPSKIKPKRFDSVQFVVNNYMDVVGMTSRALAPEDNQGLFETASDSLSLVKATNGDALIGGAPILPREKFLVLTIAGKNCDPRGQSVLAPAFHMWHLKTQIWPEYLRYLLLCAIPLLVGYTPEQEGMKEILRDPSGNPIKDPATGKFLEANPVEILRDALLHARNSEVLAVKGGSKVQEIGAQGAGTPFTKAIELFDSQMESAILYQTLATSEGVYQSRAASAMHMSVLDQLIWWLKGVVIDMLVADLLRPMVRFNFGDDALEFTPVPTLGDTERREFATDGITVATLYKAGYLQPDQLKQTDAMLGLPIRETIDPLQVVQQLQGAGVPIVAVPPPPQQQAIIQAGPGGGSNPVPIAKSGAPVPVGQADAGGSSVKLPATGRNKAKINKSPKNIKFPRNVNLSEEILEAAEEILEDEEER